MVKAELEYNPYVLETVIKFNEQKPRINSLVEKYEKEPLRNWIDKIPKIFYDEMNGYDFELEFSGTDRDYQELKSIFERNGIKEDQVHIFHKNKLSSRKENDKKIDELLEWLLNNRNSHFDFEIFKKENSELFDGMYSLIIINGKGVDTSAIDDLYISVEMIDDVNELNHTKLEDTPILIYVSSNTVGELVSLVTTLMKRNDIQKNQLFFMIDPLLNKLRVERILKDIGIDHPQMVKKINDEVVQRYLELYPYSNYLHDSLFALRNAVDRIKSILEEETKVKAEENNEIYDKIDIIEGNINRLKEAQERIGNAFNYEVPETWNNCRHSFMKFIMEWRSKKTIIKKFNEVETYASDFETDVIDKYFSFLHDIKDLYLLRIHEINTKYDEWYDGAKYKDGFKPNVYYIVNPKVENNRLFKSELIKLKSTEFVQPKEGLIGKLFKESNDLNKESTFYLQDWRNHVYRIYEPIVGNVLIMLFNTTCDYEKKLQSSYIQHISEEIIKQNEEKNIVSSQLSDDEIQLQDDNDWVREFDDLLRSIERG